MEIFSTVPLIAGLDVLPQPEGVVGQEEGPGHDVPHQGLGPEADGEPGHPGPGQERPDVHPQGGEPDKTLMTQTTAKTVPRARAGGCGAATRPSPPLRPGR